MKSILLGLLFTSVAIRAAGQIIIHDEAIRNQQERMVFKQWDKDNFIPEKGFLGLNPLYWMTWGLHPDYPKKDKRPLGPIGPQTQRLALMAAMAASSKQYKLESDTLNYTAISEALNYTPLLSDTDPLWLIFYRSEFDPLINTTSDPLAGTSNAVKYYLIRNGALNWYLEEINVLKERLQIARTSILDRGSRIIAYHRLLKDYRRLQSTWDSKRQNARKQLQLYQISSNMAQRKARISNLDLGKSDVEIAISVLSKSKL